MGLENAGASCYLASCVVLLVAHQWLRWDEASDEALAQARTTTWLVATPNLPTKCQQSGTSAYRNQACVVFPIEPPQAIMGDSNLFSGEPLSGFQCEFEN